VSTTKVNREIALDEVRRVLSDTLGPAYQVTAASDSTLKVRRFPLVTARVNVTWDENETILQAAPGEVWFLQGMNALTIYPKVRHALSLAFAQAP